MSKNVQANIQLHSLHVLVRLRSKSFKLGFSNTWTENFQMFKLSIEEAEEPEIKLPTSAESWRKQSSSRKTLTPAWLTMLKPLTVWIITNCGKLLKIQEYQTILPESWETCMQVKKQQLEPCMEPLTSSRLRKEYYRALSCHLVCLIYMVSTSWEMPGWMSYKLEPREAGETSTTSDMWMIPP